MFYMLLSLPDPWDILNGSSEVILPGGIKLSTYQQLFTTFRYLITGICIVAIMIGLINIIAANMMGNSKDIQEHKRVISDKLLIIIIISMMATILSWGKVAVDSIFQPSGTNIDLSSEQSAPETRADSYDHYDDNGNGYTNSSHDINDVIDRTNAE